MSKLPEVCPVCGKKMEKGFIHSGYPEIFWSKDSKTQHFVYTFSKDKMAPKHPLWEYANLPAYRCNNCKTVLFSYEEEGK